VALHATQATVYTDTLTSATLSAPPDLSAGMTQFMKAPKGRTLTKGELEGFLECLSSFDTYVNDSELEAGCAQEAKMIVRIGTGTDTVDVSLDPDCGHVEFWKPGAGKGAFVWGVAGSGLKEWARRIDRTAMVSSQP
jgi:hypothetical protein